MKKYKKKIILGILVLGTGFLIWFLFHKPTESGEWTGGRITAENWQSYVKQVGQEQVGITYIERIRGELFMATNVSIRFYGKIIDQLGEPIEGAEIDMCWTTSDSLSGTLNSIIYSNKDGLFSIIGIRGKGLGMIIQKEGYYDVSGYENQTSFEYANPYEKIYHDPDPNNPVIFKMRKKGTQASLITGKVVLNLPGQASGGMDFWARKYMEVSRTYLFGKAVSAGEGQMQVTTSRPVYSTEYINTGGKTVPYDWSIDIKFPDGGFIETDEIFPFLAPESGYQSTYSQKSHIEDGLSKGREFRKQWYFHIGNPPQYGLMKIYAYGAGDKVSIKYLLNPTAGDRNLEPLEKEYREWK